MPTPDRVEHIEGPTRVASSWRPAAVLAALRQLQLGDFSNAGHLADSVLGDDRIGAVLDTRVNGLLGLPIEFDAALDDHDRATEIAGVLKEDFWRIAPEPVLNEWLTYALLVGACAAELVWDVSGERALPKLKVWHPSTLRRSDDGRWFIRLASGQEMPITPGDGKWALLAPYGERRAGTRALIRRLALPWLSKNYAVSDWNRYSEAHGSPTKVGRHPAGAAEQDKAAFLASLRALANDAAAVVPEGWNVELLEAKVGSGEVFEKLIDWADKAIAVAVLGQNLTTDVEGGSHAAAQVHENVRQDLIDSDTETLATTTREQVIVWWAEYNFPAGRELAPWPNWDSSPPADEAQLAESRKTSAEAIQILADVQSRLPLPIDWRQVAEQHRVPLREGEDAPDGPLPFEPGLLTPGPRLATRGLRLASGDDIESARSFAMGQLYADEIGERANRSGAAALRPTVERVLELVDAATDYESLRASLLSEFADLEVSELRDLTASSVTLAMLAGRLAARDDDE